MEDVKYVKLEDVKVGDKFRLVERPELDYEEVACGFDYDMEDEFGKIVTVSEIDDWCKVLDYVAVKENDWHWDVRFLELIDSDNEEITKNTEEKPNYVLDKRAKEELSQLAETSELETKERILKSLKSSIILNHKFEKLINNGDVIILFFKNLETGKFIKTISKCDYEDDFDFKTGVAVALIKMTRKIADKEYKKFVK